MVWQKLPKENQRRFKWLSFFWFPIVLSISFLFSRWILGEMFGPELLSMAFPGMLFALVCLWALCTFKAYTVLNGPIKSVS